MKRFSIFLLVFFSYDLWAGEILHHAEKGPWWVYRADQGPVCLISSPPPSTLQHSCIDPDHPDHIIMPYIKVILGCLYIHPTPRKILVLGVGGGSLIKALATLVPEAQITAVEIDPLLIPIAKQYFHLPSREQIQYVIGDGATFVQNDTQTYDLIIQDVFEDGTCAPSPFRDITFIKTLKRRLSPQGVFVVNTISACPLHAEEMQLYQDVFGNLTHFSISVNEILMMTPSGKASAFEELEQKATQWEKAFQKLNVETFEILSCLHFPE